MMLGLCVNVLMSLQYVSFPSVVSKGGDLYSIFMFFLRKC